MRVSLRLWSLALLAVTVLSGSCAKETGEPLESGTADMSEEQLDEKTREYIRKAVA